MEYDTVTGVWFKPSTTIPNNNKLILIDMDDTILKGNLKSKNESMLMVDTIPSILQNYVKHGYGICIITNQYVKTTQKNIVLPRINECIRLVGFDIGVYAPTMKNEYRKPCVNGFAEYILTQNPNINDIVVVGDAAGRKTDHSSVDIDLAWNISLVYGIKTTFYTPDEFFSHKFPGVIPRGNFTYFYTSKDYNLPPIPPTKIFKLIDKLVTKKICIFPIGYPGCGKSYLMNEIVKQYGFGLISNDIPASKKNLKGYLNGNKNFIFDNTNLSKSQRSKSLAQIKGYDYTTVCVYFDVPIKVCMLMNQYRKLVLHVKYVEDIVYRVMSKKLEFPSSNEFDYVESVRYDFKKITNKLRFEI